jgi:hypothetical protein
MGVGYLLWAVNMTYVHFEFGLGGGGRAERIGPAVTERSQTIFFQTALRKLFFFKLLFVKDFLIFIFCYIIQARIHAAIQL